MISLFDRRAPHVCVALLLMAGVARNSANGISRCCPLWPPMRLTNSRARRNRNQRSRPSDGAAFTFPWASEIEYLLPMARF